MAKGSNPQKLHQGKLLRSLADWYGGTDENFALAIDYSGKTFYTLVSQERISEKTLIKICRLLNIPINYFQGEYVLPLQKPTLNEPEPVYGKSNMELQEEVRSLHQELHAAWKRIAELQDALYQKQRNETAS